MKTLLILACSLLGLPVYGQQSGDYYWLSYTDTSSGESLTGYKKMDGTIAIPARYLWVDTDTFYKMAIVFDQGWVCIDRNAKVILHPFIFDNGPDYESEGLFRFEENGKIGFADQHGIKVIQARYSFATPFSGGLSSYTIGGHKQYDKSGEHWTWAGGEIQGYVNRKGQEFEKVLPAQHNRREAWTKEGKQVWLDHKGRIIEVLKY